MGTSGLREISDIQRDITKTPRRKMAPFGGWRLAFFVGYPH